MRPSLPDPRSEPSSLAEIETLFWAALERDAGEREGFLDRECAGQPEVRDQVERLLRADRTADTFLEEPLPEALARDLPVDRLADWDLIEPIGEGGLGVVYRAAREQDGVRLEAALKILRPGFDTGAFRERFVRERQILAGLDHPAIVRVMDCGASEDGRSFLAMEFVHGRPLDQYLADAHPAPHKRIELFETICDAVAYLHARLIVHGDIKPSNVLVTAAGAPKLLDFGAACWLVPDSTERGELTRILLTPLYASPEQKRGEGPSVLSDIYSLGRLLEEMLPAAMRSRDVNCIRERCLAEEPAGRYQSASELLEDLRRLREGLPLRARPATAIYVAGRFLRRNRAVAALTALLVVSLAAGWWNADRQGRRAAAAAEEANRQHDAAVENERRARESQARAEASARDAILSANRLDALVDELINDEGAGPNVAGQQQAAVENSLREAAQMLPRLPGPARWREVSIIWRRVAMIMAHRGEFTAALNPMAKARAAADAFLAADPGPASHFNSTLVRLYEVRLRRDRGDVEPAAALSRQAMAEFRRLPPPMQARLTGSVWVEETRLTVARDMIRQDQWNSAATMIETSVRNSQAHGEVEIRNRALMNLIYVLRRQSRVADAEHWCRQSRAWNVVERRFEPFCSPPITAFTANDPMFPQSAGPLSNEDLLDTTGHITQLVKDLRGDPNSFETRLDLGRAYARLATHYLTVGDPNRAAPVLREAAAIRDAFLKRDSESPVVLAFRKRIDTLQGRLAAGR